LRRNKYGHQDTTKESAIDYAKGRAKLGDGEIRVLDSNGVIEFNQRG